MFKEFVEKTKKNFTAEMCEKCITRLISSWCLSCLLTVLSNTQVPTKKEFFSGVNLITAVLCTVVFFVVINIVMRIVENKNFLFEKDSLVLFFSVTIYCMSCVTLDKDGYFIIGMIAPAVAATVYFLKKNESFFERKDISKKKADISVWVFTAIVFVVISSIGVFRYLTYSTPNFDFGVFAQTCYSIKTKFLQLNTTERDGLISHMQVHLSPVLYLTAPFYLVFKTPAVLQVVQALVLASSAIPLYLICKKYELSSKVSVVVCFLAAFYPALTTGTYYDFHENAFLTAFILWFMYFMEKEKPIPMYIFMLLTFSVKEDAAMYMAFIGLYMLTQKGKRVHGLSVISSAVLYFGICIYILQNHGLGVMSGRFDEYIVNENLGLISVVISAFTNPAYVIKNCFSSEKIIFILQTLLPLLFLPLMTKKASRFILVGPYILINLMPNYVYQHSIDFQYVYGVMALFFYLTVINIKDLKSNIKRNVLPIACVITVIMFSGLVLPKAYYVEKYIDNREDYKKMSEILSVIPDDAGVTATTFLVPRLCEREIIYEIEYTEYVTEYLALDLRYEKYRQREDEIDPDKYELVSREEDLVAVYKLKSKDFEVKEK